MAITVKHNKVSTIPDDADTSLVRPSDWNDDHVLTGTVPVANGGTGAATLTGYVYGNGVSAMTASTTIPSTAVTGLGTMSTQNANNVSITGGSISGTTVSGYIPTTEKAVANGVATLDGSGTVPISQLPSAVLGALSYQGTWNASTNTPTLTSSVGTKGYYYVVNVAGSTNLNGITDWQVGDWAVYNGTAWQKIDNTDAVTSVNGYTGTVVLTNTDISGFGTMSTQNANAVAITGGAIDGTTIGATTTSTGKFTTLNASTSLTTPTVQASNSGGLSLKNSAGTTQISMGAGGGDNASINVSTNINGTNAQIDISPTGTGHVHINPTGVNSIQINPTYVGTMDNMTIGATTPKAITGTTVTATSFSGSGSSLTGVVTSVTGTSPVVSSGGQTPAISMPAATTSVSGYLTSTDWTTFNNKSNTSGTVTSVAATVPSFLSVSGSPITSSGTLALTYSGTALPILNGGTGQTTASAAFNALSPLTTAGDTLYGGTSGAGTRLAIGTAGQVLTVNAGATAPQWSTPTTGTVTSVSGTTGRITSTGGNTPVIDLASGVATAGTTGSASLIPVVTIDTYGRVTGITTAANPQGTVTSVTGTAPVVSSGGATPAISMPAATGSVNGYLTSTDWTTFNGKGSGSVTSVSVTSANGFAGTVATATTTPAITISTSITGVLKGNATAISAATAGTDYSAGTSANTSGLVYSTTTTGALTTATGAQISTALGTTAISGNAANVTGIVAAANGGTAQSTYATGDILYASAANTLSKLTVGSTGQVLTVASGAPSWAAASSSNITAQGLYENSATISANYTIGTGNNAMSAGPITVNTGVTVTVPTGSTWVIV